MKQLQAVDEVKRQIVLSKGNINLTSMSVRMNYSEKYLARIFRQAEGCSMKSYAMNVRIEEAMKLLQSGREDQIYEKLGYFDQSHFDRDFRRQTNMTPGQYKKLYGLQGRNFQKEED